jgi:hypothetical protein
MPVILNNFKGRIRTAIAKIDEPFLQNVSHEVEYRPDVSRETNGAYIELA